MAPKQKPSSSKQDYTTPLNFMKATKKLLGITDFAFDLACDVNNCQSPNGGYIVEIDALKQDWLQLKGWLYLNPPYKDIKSWAEKCASSWAMGAKIALLVPASVGSNWYRDYVRYYSYTFFLNGRLAFIPDKPAWLFPKDLMLCLYNHPYVGNAIWTWKDIL